MTIKISSLFIPVNPVPASRPRVTRWGTYFTKNYEDFRNASFLFLDRIKKKFPQTDSQYKVEIEFICRRPKNPANVYPRGDTDNYLKGPLDSFTKVGMFWHDDVQVIHLTGSKRYALPNEDFGMRVTITELV